MQWWCPYISSLNFLWGRCWCSRLPCQGKWPKPQPSDPDLGSTCQHPTPCHFACLPPCLPSPVDAPPNILFLYRADWHFELLLNLCHLHNHVLRCSSKILTNHDDHHRKSATEVQKGWRVSHFLRSAKCAADSGVPVVPGYHTIYLAIPYLTLYTISSTAIQLPLKQAK